jgi:ATP-binding cassette subfamily B protein
LVLDEATGALDPATEAEVASGYEELMRGRTTIVITHRPELARRTGRIVTLERGGIVNITTPNHAAAAVNAAESVDGATVKAAV